MPYQSANSRLAGLPEGTQIVEVVPWGASAWTQTARVTTELPDGDIKEYFLKTCSSEIGPVMMEGEFTSLVTIKALMPDLVPQAYGWGQYSADPGTYFLIMDFLDLIAELPDPTRFAELVSELHRKGESPNGMFGFDVPTCHGKLAHANKWDSDWCRFFTNLVTETFEEDLKTNGPCPGYAEAFATLKAHVIPRLLQPLQADGRTIVPRLVHGDLWEENVGTSVETGDPVLYDPSVIYAHHEYELGMWRRCVVFDQTYFRQYLLRFPPSEPTEEWEDRNRLYALRYNLAHSLLWLGTTDETRITSVPERFHYTPMLISVQLVGRHVILEQQVRARSRIDRLPLVAHFPSSSTHDTIPDAPSPFPPTANHI